MPLYHFLFGYHVLRCEEKYVTRLYNLLYSQKIVAYPLERSAWYIPHGEAKRLEKILTESKIEANLGNICGAPQFFVRYRHRVGLLIGGALGILLLYVALHHIWAVEITGNETIPDAVIAKELEALGFGIGSKTEGHDLAAIADAYRTSHDDIAYMGIYTQGMVAHVKVRETIKKDDTGSEEKTPSCLVAGEDAVIYHLGVTHGTAAVSVGDVVKKGELLVNGVAEGAHYDRLLSAEGVVIGVVSESFHVEIPLMQEKKTSLYTEKGSFSINFFGKCINIFRNTGNSGATYGTIEREEKIRLPNGRLLPLSFSFTDHVFYQSEDVLLSPSAAYKLAFATLEAEILSRIGNGELIAKEQWVDMGEDTVKVFCRLSYTKNIAVRQSIGLITP